MEKEDELQMEHFAHLAKAWGNECGGSLYAEIAYELEAKNKQIELPRNKILFEATEKKFVTAGESILVHDTWRARELLLLCQYYLRSLTRELNPGHPDFREEIEEDNDLYTEEDLSRRPSLIEPNITRRDLEERIANWYLDTKNKTNFQIPTEDQKPELSLLPQSALYFIWELENHKITQADKKIESIQSSQKTENDNNKQNANLEKNIVKYSDLEDEELNNQGVINKLYSWTKKSDDNDEIHKAKITSALSQAQRNASEKHKNGMQFPIRLRIYSNDYMLHRVAMIKLGHQGGKSCTYRIIKENK